MLKEKISRTTHYRRLRKARSLDVDVSQLQDNRGKHKNHKRGSDHHRWSDSIITADGYVKIRTGTVHPLSDPNGYVYEHTLIMTSFLGRELAEDEVIHHINGDRRDNRTENLQLMSKAEHNRLHIPERDGETGRFKGSEAQ